MRRIPLSIRYVFSVYVVGLLFFTFFRCLLLLGNAHQLPQVPGLTGIISMSLLTGWRFDTAISGYILALPALVLMGSELFRKINKWILLPAHLFLCAAYTICFLMCAADIPFFANYNNRLNITILNWTHSPLFMVKMVLEDKVFLAYLGLFIITAILFVLIMNRIYRRFLAMFAEANIQRHKKGLLLQAASCLIFLGFLLLGIRGRTDAKTPIVPGMAYFCSYNLPNQAGLNPVFNFIWSWTDGWKDENKPLTLMNSEEALQNTKRELGIQGEQHDIARVINSADSTKKYNVVVILMESMSASYMRHFGGKYDLTPTLDSLADHSYFFTNFYSAGIHTFNGIFSTLFGFPALMAHHSMEGAIIPSYTGLPLFFSQRGYETMYFTTHDEQFDNTGGFLSVNHMQTIISAKNYPPAELKSTLGVPDHYMFRYSLPLLTGQNVKNKPFFAVFMTSSNHNPYIVPTGIPYQPQHTDVRGGCVSYSDWAIGDFMRSAAAMPWYGNTIFVLLGDHGTYDGDAYGDLAYAYSHIPCIIFSPMFTDKPQIVKNPGGQIDIFPTIAGLIGGSYTNNTLGIDLLHAQRHYTFFSQDDKIGVADTSDIYIWHKDNREEMFTLAGHKPVLRNKRLKADSMKNYAFSMIQSAQWLRDNQKTGY